MTGTDVMMLVRQRANDLDRTRYSDSDNSGTQSIE